MTNEDEMTDKYYDREITLNNGERMTVREFLAIRRGGT
jgi:hypothetical protein